MLRDIAVGAQAAVVFVDFSRAPEAKFPVAIEQIYAAAKYVCENSDSLNVDASRLAVAGDSVGGNMTAALTMLAKERGGVNIATQVLFYPVTDASFDSASYRSYATDHFLQLAERSGLGDPDLTAGREKRLGDPDLAGEADRSNPVILRKIPKQRRRSLYCQLVLPTALHNNCVDVSQFHIYRLTAAHGHWNLPVEFQVGQFTGGGYPPVTGR